jgi:hypothetical protein
MEMHIQKYKYLAQRQSKGVIDNTTQSMYGATFYGRQSSQTTPL